MKNYTVEDKKLLKSLGLRIRKLRKRAGFSQENFAYEAGVNRAYMGGIERGEHNITVLSIKKIADCLGVNMDTILKGLK